MCRTVLKKISFLPTENRKSVITKVKFNICNCHYALQKVQENGEMAFETPVAMPGAVSIALDPNGEPESFYC